MIRTMPAVVADWPTADSTICQSGTSFAFAMSIVIAFGMLISYLPQIYKILANKSSKGLSPFYLFLGAICQEGTMLNAIVVYAAALSCCKQTSGKICLEKAMNFITLSVQMLCFGTIVLLYMLYYPRDERYDYVQANGRTVRKSTSGYKLAKFVVYFNAAYLLAGAMVIGIVAAVKGKELGLLDPTVAWIGFAYGNMSVVITCIQYLPQIWKTLRTKDVGSLSMLTLLIQCPGSFVFVYVMMQDEGPNFSTWGVYAIAGTYQLVLLLICLYFTYVRPPPGQVRIHSADPAIAGPKLTSSSSADLLLQHGNATPSGSDENLVGAAAGTGQSSLPMRLETDPDAEIVVLSPPRSLSPVKRRSNGHSLE